MRSLLRVKKLLATAFALSMLLMFNGCKKDDPEPDYPAPSITVSEESLELKPGESTSLTLTIVAEGGLESIVVNKNGGFMEEITLSDKTVTTYDYTITADTDVAEGDVIEYEFIGVNTQEKESGAVDVVVNIAVYTSMDVDGTKVYEVDIPENNLVPEGTTIKFAKDRGYYLTGSLNFPENTTLVAEEGATIYFTADSIFIYVEGTVDIQGTSSNPVVMTSAKTIINGEEPAAGDWMNFELEGTGNGSDLGTIKYLRLEYADDRGFRLDNVGNGTDISYVQTYEIKEEGVMVTDGDVNLKYIVSTNSEDSNFRLGDSYQGMGQFLIAINSTKGEEAFYIRDDSQVKLANVTVVGPGVNTADDGFENAGVRFRSSNGGEVYNAIVTGLPDWGVRSDSIPTDIDGDRVLAYSNVYDNDSRDDDFADVFFTETSFNNSEDAIAGITVGSIVPDSEATSSFNPSSIDAFFDAATFKGAIQNAANDWTVGWVKNPDGSIR